jgi:hypothetical protein
MSNRLLAEEIMFPGSGYSIEKNTEQVEKNGKYYIVKDGQPISSHRNLPHARKALAPFLDEIGWKPTVSEPPLKTADDIIRQDINWRVQHESELFDANSHNFKKRPKGPK